MALGTSHLQNYTAKPSATNLLTGPLTSGSISLLGVPFVPNDIMLYNLQVQSG